MIPGIKCVLVYMRSSVGVEVADSRLFSFYLTCSFNFSLHESNGRTIEQLFSFLFHQALPSGEAAHENDVTSGLFPGSHGSDPG